MIATRIAAILCVATAGPLAAQTPKVVPAGTTYDEGNGRSFFPGVLTGGRTQQITDASELTASTVLLRELAMRADGSNAAGFFAHKFARWIVTVGQTRVAARSMSTTFAANRGATMTKVFDGAFTMPRQPPIKSPPRPFNIIVKFNSPFVFVGARGNLVWEIEIPGKTLRRILYFTDGQVGLSGGSARRFGTGGVLALRDSYTVTTDTTKLVDGGSADLSAAGLKKPYAALAAYGFSNKSFGPLPLPFDLAPLGAPGNHIYASLDLLLPLALKPQGSTFGGSVSLPIPPRPFAGLKLFGQALFFDNASNNLGIVFSDALELVIGSTNKSPCVAIGSYDSTLATGTWAVRNANTSAPGGIVERF